MDENLVIVNEKSPITLNEKLIKIVEQFVKSFISPCTKYAYAKDIEQFLLFCKDRNYNFSNIQDISSKHFQEYRDFLLNEMNYANNTVIRKMVAMRALMDWCFFEGIISRNPLLNVRLPKSKQISTTVDFSDEEVRKILSLPVAYKSHGALHLAVLTMLFYLGLRKSELVNLKIKDISEERNHKVLTIYGKGDKFRKIPLAPHVLSVIENYISTSKKVFTPDSYLFQPTMNNYSKEINKPLNKSTIDWIIQHYSRKAGINKKISPHSARATIVGHLLDSKVPIRDIANFIGHSSIQTTSIYDKRKDNLDSSAAYQVRY